jgi:hypothetical protein
MSKRQGGDLDSQGVNGAKIQKTEVAANGLQQVGMAIYDLWDRLSVHHPSSSHSRNSSQAARQLKADSELFINHLFGRHSVSGAGHNALDNQGAN